MSWLDFANHFLSNQRLHAWSWINRAFSGMVFLVGNLALGISACSFSLFLFSAGWKSRWRTRFWLAIKERGTLQVMVSFLFVFARDKSLFFQILSGPKTFLHISFVFFGSLIGNLLSFFFCFLPILIGNIFFFFRFLLIFDWEFFSWSTFVA